MGLNDPSGVTIVPPGGGAHRGGRPAGRGAAAAAAAPPGGGRAAGPATAVGAGSTAAQRRRARAGGQDWGGGVNRPFRCARQTASWGEGTQKRGSDRSSATFIQQAGWPKPLQRFLPAPLSIAHCPSPQEVGGPSRHSRSDPACALAAAAAAGGPLPVGRRSLGAPAGEVKHNQISDQIPVKRI